MSGNAITDAAKKHLREKEENRLREFKKERGVIWLTKAAAAERVGVSRVTLDKWIADEIIPASAVLDAGIKRKTRINADELDTVAASRKMNKPGEAAKQKDTEREATIAKNRELEIQVQSLTNERDTLQSSLLRITDLSDKRLEDKDQIIAVRLEVEANLRDQLAKAEARAEAAEKNAKKGLLGKIFG